MDNYLALLRGINVGGNALIRMADLKAALTASGLSEVKTYIQSGNVIFQSSTHDTAQLARTIKAAIRGRFSLNVEVAVFSKQEWQDILKAAPAWWGSDKEWKHNLLIMIQPCNMPETVQAIGKLKPGIEKMKPGMGVLYQSVSLKMFGRTTAGKLASNPIYKKMTIRNYNTATKLMPLFD